jgi:hypothetical protein
MMGLFFGDFMKYNAIIGMGLTNPLPLSQAQVLWPRHNIF